MGYIGDFSWGNLACLEGFRSHSVSVSPWKGQKFLFNAYSELNAAYFPGSVVCLFWGRPGRSQQPTAYALIFKGLTVLLQAPQKVGAFKVAASPVTIREFRDFVLSEGYQNSELWSGDSYKCLAGKQKAPATWTVTVSAFMCSD